MKGTGISRRTFLRTAAAATVLSAAARRGYAANNQIRLGHIGVGGQGGMHVGLLSQMEDVKVVAVCDVDESHLNHAAESSGQNPDKYTDFRKLLERKDIDAVIVATPDHWHVPVALLACEAGKDMYVEKPVCHNIREGRLLADAAKKHNRVVQVGMQQRSGTHWQSAIERIHAGELGQIAMVNAWNTWSPKEMFGDLGNPPDEATPPGVDYDMWLGPAPKRPFNPKRFHGTWYFFWDYSGAMISAWGMHLFDIVAWAMGPEIERVSTVGGKLTTNDMRETPDTAECIFQCPKHVLTYSMRHNTGWRPFGDMDHGIEFLGDKATLQINRSGYQIYREEDRSTRKPFYTEDNQRNNNIDHHRDFIECIRSRNPTRATAEIGLAAATFGHLANISYRVGKSVEWDREKETIVGDEEAVKLLRREYREPWAV